MYKQEINCDSETNTKQNAENDKSEYDINVTVRQTLNRMIKLKMT